MDASTQPERQHYNVTLAALVVAGIAFALQQTLVIPALPALQRDLDTSTAWVTWLLTAFLLSASVLTPPGPTVVGTRWREWVRLLPDAVPRRLPGGWLRVDSEVVEIDPPRLLRERFRSRWFDGTLLYTVTADEEGSVLRQQEELRPRGPLHRLAGAVDRSLRPRLLARLAAIRDVVERAG